LRKYFFNRFRFAIFANYFLSIDKKLIQDFREETPLLFRYFRFVWFAFCLGGCFWGSAECFFIFCKEKAKKTLIIHQNCIILAENKEQTKTAACYF